MVKRPVGSNKAFSQQAELPDRLTERNVSKRNAGKATRKGRSQKKPVGRRGANDKTTVASDGERKRSARKQAKEEAENLKREQRRKRAVDSIRKKINAAEIKHEAKVAEIRSQIEKLERNLVTEVGRWEMETDKLKALSRRAERM